MRKGIAYLRSLKARERHFLFILPLKNNLFIIKESGDIKYSALNADIFTASRNRGSEV